MLAACAALAVGVTACVPGTSKDDTASGGSGPVNLTFWTINLKKNFGDYVQGLIDGYRKDHPDVTLTWVDVPGNDVVPKLLSAVASGDVPDVVNLTNLNLEQFVPALADLTPYVTPEQRKGYQPTLLAPLERDGKLVGLPWYNGGSPVSIINTELVKKAGLDPADPPENFTEAMEWGKRVHAADSATYGMNGIPNDIILEMEGVPLLTPDKKKAGFNTPQAQAVLKQWAQGMKDGAIAPGATVKDERQYPQTLANRQVAFAALSFPAVLVGLQKNNPDVYAKMAVGPGALGAAGTYVVPDQQTFVVPAKSKNVKAAAEFALYLTNAANQTAFCKLAPIYPSTVESLKDPLFSQPKDDSLIDKARAQIAKQLPKTTLSSMGTGKDEELRERLREQIRAFMSGTKTAQQALADAEREWNDLLAATN
ncbi:ABC transporter substrate-binding protein [Thermoactinospora rubra]|uniref:ABC transporter substrate-binding protein n=1 Tax=Thermoactinospora rubra TaxID=1088767 RepID=UPI0013020558|nr:extracellular solute-binding protein [Thermoactinospora rubra]